MSAWQNPLSLQTDYTEDVNQIPTILNHKPKNKDVR